MDGSVSLRVKYDLSDFLKFNYWHIRKLKIALIFFLCLWFIPVAIFLVIKAMPNKGVMVLISQFRWMFTIPVFMSLLVGFVYLNIYNIGKRTIIKNPIWIEEKEININIYGITVISESSNMKLKWENILKYANTTDIIAIYYSKSAAILIPKRYTNDNGTEVLKTIEKNINKSNSHKNV